MIDGQVAVVGAGSIGLAWAIVFARAGAQVRLYDVDPAARERAPEQLRRRLKPLAHFELLDEAAVALLDRVEVVDELADAVHGSDWVQECVIEDLAVKRELFAGLDSIAAPETVLASSTSMISCSRWAADLPGRHRCLVVHPGNPPYLLPVAEVVPAAFTSEPTVARAFEVLKSADMRPVLVHGEPEGFVFNRLQGALLREAYCLVRDGVASAEDVDAVVTAGLGRRWSVLGPFATAHLNTQGGIRRHATLMGPAYHRMGAERGQDDPWTPDLVDQVADDVTQRLPLEHWDELVLRRDAALMRLEQARRGAQSDDDEAAGDF
jgi:L-gulonate 3-dehydrogenase